MWEKQYTSNPNDMSIAAVEKELARRFDAHESDAFCSYVLGCIWKRKNDPRAASAFFASISLFPYFWSCWKALSDMVVNSTLFNSISDSIDNKYILKYFFLLLTTNRLTQVNPSINPYP